MTYLIQGNQDTLKTEDHYTESAIIGFWRMGATPGEIAHAVNWPIENVKEIIELYKFEHKIKSDDQKGR